jgi:hypothetical protein
MKFINKNFKVEIFINKIKINVHSINYKKIKTKEI